MNDFEKIEHLLLSKKFEELNPSELKEVQTHFENATDYNDMRDTLMQVKSTLAADKLLIKPNVDLKEKLLQQFEQTYSNNKTGGGKTTPFYKKMVFQWSAAASVVIMLSFGAVYVFNNATGNKKEMAINKDNPKKDEMAPGYEKSNIGTETTGAMTDSTSTTVHNSEERNEEVTANEPSSITEDVEENKNTTFGNISLNESKVTEGDVNNGFVPAEDERMINNQNLKDNNVDTRKTNDVKKETSRDDANYYYNDAILKGKEESKTLELDNTMPVNKVNTVNEKNRSSNTKDYWANKKQKTDKDGEKTEMQGNTNIDSIQLGGYKSVNQMVQQDKKDTTNAKLDSTKVDSTKVDSTKINQGKDVQINQQKSDD